MWLDSTCSSLANKQSKKDKWYNFEENIENISTWLCNKMINEIEESQTSTEKANNNDTECAGKKIRECINIFENINTLLVEYLKKEFSGKKIEKIKAFEKEITLDSYVLSFNYTDTIKLYTKNFTFVHGSINDDCGNIVLGFPQNDISDFCTGNYMRLHKDFQKEKLYFFRFLQEKKYEINKEVLEEFDRCAQGLLSGSGEYILGEHDVNKNVLEYIEKNQFSRTEDTYDYSNVEEIVIIGHGLEADLIYLERIFQNSKMLKLVKILFYDGETCEEISRKICTLRNLCSSQFHKKQHIDIMGILPLN